MISRSSGKLRIVNGIQPLNLVVACLDPGWRGKSQVWHGFIADPADLSNLHELQSVQITRDETGPVTVSQAGNTLWRRNDALAQYLARAAFVGPRAGRGMTFLGWGLISREEAISVAQSFAPSSDLRPDWSDVIAYDEGTLSSGQQGRSEWSWRPGDSPEGNDLRGLF